MPLYKNRVAPLEEIRLGFEEIQLRSFHVYLEDVTTRLAEMAPPVVLNAHARDANLLPLALEVQLLDIGQVARRADIRFIQIEFREVARATFAHDAVKPEDLG